jgi:exonuclease III
MDYNPEVLSMNVRGLNDPVKRDAVREFVNLIKVNLVCPQETRLDVVDAFIVMQCLGPSFDSFTYLPAQETRGGVLVAWDSSVLNLARISFDSFSVNAEVTGVDNLSWWISVVYGPQSRDDKIQFLRELTERRALCPGPWLLIGDFNMILRAAEKNNENLDRGMMAKFRDFVGHMELRDLYMHGRLYTWSNEREVPTMTRIDRALVSVDWDLAFPDAMLQALLTSISDHAPLHLSLSNGLRPKQWFKFEVFWASLPGFLEAVREAWVCDHNIVDPFKRLDALFRNTAASLQS